MKLNRLVPTRRLLGLLLLTVALALAGCAATSALGKAKEALLYDKQLGEGAYEAAARMYVSGQLPKDRFDQATAIYSKWRSAHVVAVQLVATAEAAQNLGKPFDQAQAERVRLAATAALTDFVNLLTSFGVLK